MIPKLSASMAASVIKVLLLVSVASSVPIQPGRGRDVDYNDQNMSFEDKTFKKYTTDLLSHYNNKDYFAAIYRDEKTRNDFAKFLNEGLTQQTKDDLAGLRFYKKMGDVEVPVVMFSPQMDAWLGVLPQWKRTKRFMFKKIEEYLSLHPELLNGEPLRPIAPFKIQARKNS